MGLLGIVTFELNSVMMLIVTTPFVAVGLGGMTLLWRSDVDKRRGVLTIWNWLGKREFSLSQVESVDIDYTAASSGVTTGHIDERTGALSSSSDSASHGPLWRVYVAVRDKDDSFRIHIATIESRRKSAQCMAIAIAEICDCPIRSMHGLEQECDGQPKHNQRKGQQDNEN